MDPHGRVLEDGTIEVFVVEGANGQVLTVAQAQALVAFLEHAIAAATPPQGPRVRICSHRHRRGFTIMRCMAPRGHTGDHRQGDDRYDGRWPNDGTPSVPETFPTEDPYVP